MQARVSWDGRMTFKGTADTGFTVPLGASPVVGGDEDGFRPMELILVGLAGCTAMDVISILKKTKQDISSFEVKVQAEQSSEHPKVFNKISIEFIVSGHHVDSAAVDRSIELSSTKYCPVQAMLGDSVPIETSATIIELSQ
ncbi:MAG: OsmC family protein [Anaerolineaceae bacterium]|nr:OsmC family protein [Anaerolineaceae bacterium]